MLFFSFLSRSTRRLSLPKEAAVRIGGRRRRSSCGGSVGGSSSSFLQRRCLSTTYYDSQSGLHLPVHDETEIKLFLDVRNSSTKFVVPHNLSKDRLEAEELSETLSELSLRKGIHGLILPAIRFPRDLRNLYTLSVIAPPGFCLLNETNHNNSSSSTMVDDGLIRAQNASSSSSCTTVSKILKYDPTNATTGSTNDNDETRALREALQRTTDKGLHTTLFVGGGEDESDPITLANNIASLIDSTNGGCDYIWISANDVDKNNNDDDGRIETKADTMVRVCEELVYLDVAGATIKSRLLVDAVNEDMVEDTMFAGVNKYVVDHEDQAEWVETVAKEQGKSLLRNP